MSKISLCVVLASLTTSCLRTRAQMKEDGPDEASAPSKPVAAQVQEVQPKEAYVIDEVKSEITRLTGRIEDLERAQKQATATGAAANKDDFKKLETRMNELEQAQAQMIESFKRIQSGVPQPENKEAFERGRNQFKNKDYAAAIESFNQYLSNPKSKQAEDATFLRGESYFEAKEFKKAIVDFSKFPEKYTRSKRLPFALYRIGLSFESLGMKEDARGFFQELVEKFPSSPEAKKAKAKTRS